MVNVIVENQDFETLIRHYDRPDAFFYLEPPYFSTEDMYEVDFGWDDHERLRKTLGEIKSRFVTLNIIPCNHFSAFTGTGEYQGSLQSNKFVVIRFFYRRYMEIRAITRFFSWYLDFYTEFRAKFLIFHVMYDKNIIHKNYISSTK